MDKENTGAEARRTEKAAAAKSFVKPAIAVSAFTVCLIFVLFRFDSVRHAGSILLNAINSFLIGLFIAYILNVFLNLFENVIFGRLTRGSSRFWNIIRRPLCVALSFAVVLLIILAIALYIVPEIFKSLELIGETARVNIPIYIEIVTKWIEQISTELNLDLTTSLNFLKDFNWTSILTGATEFTTNFLSSLVNATVNVASGIFTFILAVIFSVYFLMGKESLLLSMKRIAYSLLPKKAVATAADLAVTANNVFSSFVRGQLTECVILGCLCFIGMSLIGFDYALLISCIITLTALIPILGAYIGCGIGAFLLLLVDPMDAVWFVVFIICLQQFEGNVIYPKVVGSTIGLPGVWVMTAVTVFSNLFGIMGIILGTPIAAVLYTVFRRVTSNRLSEKGITNEDLAPGKYPYIEESYYISRTSGRPLSAPVLERGEKRKNPEKPQNRKPGLKGFIKKK
ncbi:MAG: AI-2E family transporter [Hominenteromicrobium sp.]